jgi:hypothetical protein
MLLLVASLFVFGACSRNSGSSSEESVNAMDVGCMEPSNPWADEGGGHDAGFKWAEEKGEECPSDHGQSFEEGCNEYYEQLHRYEACEASKKK